jgi:hypothetical protein
MLDYWPDGKIDCKDYAIHNSIEAEKHGYKPRRMVLSNHVVVVFDVGNYTIVLDGQRVYRLPRGLLKGLSVLAKSAKTGH